MEQNSEPRKSYHDLASKCASLKSAIKILRNCQPEERKEMLALMTEAANTILKCLSELDRYYNPKN